MITKVLGEMVEEKKKDMALMEKRMEEKSVLDINSYTEKAEVEEEEEVKRIRRRDKDRLLRGCTELEVEEDLSEIFEGRGDRNFHVTSDNRSIVVIKGQRIEEGDVVRIGKRDIVEVGRVKIVSRNVLIVDVNGKEKKFPIPKLQSVRYTICKVTP